MPTQGQISTLDFSNNLYVNALNSPNKSAAVYDLSGDYTTLDFIFNIMSGGSAVQVTSKDGYFEKPIMGRPTPTAIVAAAPVIAGNTLTVTFTDPNFTGFRIKEVLGDGTAAMNKGRVISKIPGQVVMELGPGLSAWSASHFVAGATVSPLFIASGNRGSTGVESLYEEPTYIHNQTGICRESLILYRRDLQDTYVKWAGDNWYHSQQPLMMKRFARQLEKKAYFSEYATITGSPEEGTIQYSMGIRQAILDPTRGGVYQPMTGPLTQSVFEGTMARIADRKNASMVTKKIGCGRGFLAQIQNIYGTGNVQYAGKNNTFGGESVQGTDFYKLAFNGIEVDLMIIPFLNDREVFATPSTVTSLGAFTRMQYTAIVFDEAPYHSVDGQLLPTLEKRYFGPQETEMNYIPGLIGSSLGGSKMYNGNARIAVSDKDACSMELYTDVCHDCVGYNMGLFETIV